MQLLRLKHLKSSIVSFYVQRKTSIKPPLINHGTINVFTMYIIYASILILRFLLFTGNDILYIGNRVKGGIVCQ